MADENEDAPYVEEKQSWRDFLIGDPVRYNYTALCIPDLPWAKSKHKLNFYTKGECRMQRVSDLSISKTVRYLPKPFFLCPSSR